MVHRQALTDVTGSSSYSVPLHVDLTRRSAVALEHAAVRVQRVRVDKFEACIGAVVPHVVAHVARIAAHAWAGIAAQLSEADSTVASGVHLDRDTSGRGDAAGALEGARDFRARKRLPFHRRDLEVAMRRYVIREALIHLLGRVL